VNTWIAFWFVIATVTTMALLACAVALVRHVILLGRTARQAQDELQPIADELARQGRRASMRAASLEVPGRKNPT
jgi:hypothetical protein